MADLFAVESIHNEKKLGHVVATSLFWKPACLGETDFPTPSKAVMENPAKHGLSSRFKNPWEHYVEPVFEATRHLAPSLPAGHHGVQGSGISGGAIIPTMLP